MPVTLKDIEAAAARIEGSANRTPLLRSRDLDTLLGAEVFIKPENLQVTGSFKFRGACNRLAALIEAERQRGVVAWSSGNHAQGIAAAARQFGLAAAIVMPRDAPKVKIERTRSLGAEIVLYDRQTESREEIGRALSEERGAVLVPSYDDEYIIAGQGTVGLEIMQQVGEAGKALDEVLVCCGGGGLIAGVATAVHASAPETRIFSVEPEEFDDTARSLSAGRRLQVDAGAKSICDALLAPEPGELTFPIIQRHLAGGLSVSDAEVKEAIRYAFNRLKLVVEPGGAVALAALLSGKVEAANKRIGVVLSGGNLDPEVAATILSEA